MRAVRGCQSFKISFKNLSPTGPTCTPVTDDSHQCHHCSSITLLLETLLHCFTRQLQDRCWMLHQNFFLRWCFQDAPSWLSSRCGCQKLCQLLSSLVPRLSSRRLLRQQVILPMLQPATTDLRATLLTKATRMAWCCANSRCSKSSLAL